MLYKKNSRTFKHLDQKSAVFQGFQGLEKPVMNFKYFQALQGPVRTLPIVLWYLEFLWCSSGFLWLVYMGFCTLLHLSKEESVLFDNKIYKMHIR